ncbi:hypothetical protein KJS94_07780 [Flavihumibacter rivuli]|uniref:hypothetical protein n=1 Tax=Flavihumibacter rivuli TaxID=2838156 RepID=UPI001BDE16C5|nr:hypothetical protein [Flavihumibacter rivuli]ULQ58099.1 hypothetical protein KJS94_07780 [Flavihumibacter rivuli]
MAFEVGDGFTGFWAKAVATANTPTIDGSPLLKTCFISSFIYMPGGLETLKQYWKIEHFSHPHLFHNYHLEKTHRAFPKRKMVKK